MKDTVFTMHSTPYKFGVGATEEIGHDLALLRLKRVLVVTDQYGQTRHRDNGESARLSLYRHGDLRKSEQQSEVRPDSRFLSCGAEYTSEWSTRQVRRIVGISGEAGVESGAGRDAEVV
jgi:hypothetical protein